MGEITIFNDSITKQGLQTLQEQAKDLPDIIKDKIDYALIYTHYQDARKLRIAINKKSEVLIKEKKLAFDITKSLIQDEEERILDIISPIESKLKCVRETWEESERIKAEVKASVEAERQKAEFNRQEIIRVWDEDHHENYDFDQRIIDVLARDKKDAELKARELKLEKTEAWFDAHEEKRELEKFDTQMEETECHKEVTKRIEHAVKQLDKEGIFPPKPEEKTLDDDESKPIEWVDYEGEFICSNCDFKFNGKGNMEFFEKAIALLHESRTIIMHVSNMKIPDYECIDSFLIDSERFLNKFNNN